MALSLLAEWIPQFSDALKREGSWDWERGQARPLLTAPRMLAAPRPATEERKLSQVPAYSPRKLRHKSATESARPWRLQFGKRPKNHFVS